MCSAEVRAGTGPGSSTSIRSVNLRLWAVTPRSPQASFTPTILKFCERERERKLLNNSDLIVKFIMKKIREKNVAIPGN